ncbi:MAG: TlpA family protein disulfide reductase [Sandaracinaceae bacterium]
MRNLLCVLALTLTACDDGPATTAPDPGRVVAVTADPVADPADGFCDVQPEAHPALALPPLDEASSAPSLTTRTWLNVWATWCAPCVEELPRLAAWRDRLREDGVDAQVVFLSADRDRETIDAFLASHPEVTSTLRVTDPSELGGWLPGVGLDEGAPLPLHVLTGADGHVRCARAGGVSEEHYAAVRSILAR